MSHQVLGIRRDIQIGVTGLEEIIQNVQVILTTKVGSVPLDRDFGTSWTLVDLPQPRAQAELVAEIVEKVERYEPRVKVRRVDFIEYSRSDTAEGKLVPRLNIEILEAE